MIALSKNKKHYLIANPFNNHAFVYYAFTFKNKSGNMSKIFAFLNGKSIFFITIFKEYCPHIYEIFLQCISDYTCVDHSIQISNTIDHLGLWLLHANEEKVKGKK